MPLTRDEIIKPNVRLYIWQMTEKIEDLFVPPFIDLSHFHSEHRQREVLTTYNLLYDITGRNDLRIEHDMDGKPVVAGWNISISHTKGWLAVILSPDHQVAIDIEYLSDRVKKVAKRFIRPDENGDGLTKQLIHWCAKETIYKLFGPEKLQYFEMRLKPFALSTLGNVEVENLKLPKSAWVNYEVNDDFVLTYSVLE